MSFKNSPICGHQERGDQVVSRMKTKGEFHSLVHQGHNPQEKSSSNVKDHDDISHFTNFGISEMQPTENHGSNYKRKPFVFRQNSNTLHQISSEKIFLKTGLQGHHNNGNKRKDQEGNQFKLQYITLGIIIIIN